MPPKLELIPFFTIYETNWRARDKMKVKMIYDENTKRWIMVPHWDEDNPKPPLFDPRPGHH